MVQRTPRSTQYTTNDTEKHEANGVANALLTACLNYTLTGVGVRVQT